MGVRGSGGWWAGIARADGSIPRDAAGAAQIIARMGSPWAIDPDGDGDPACGCYTMRIPADVARRVRRAGYVEIDAGDGWTIAIDMP